MYHAKKHSYEMTFLALSVFVAPKMPPLNDGCIWCGFNAAMVVWVPDGKCTYWWVVTLKKRSEYCGAESSGPCGPG